MKHFYKRHWATLLCTSSLFTLSTQVMASAFQIWEQDAASAGNVHAGYAALGTDASIAFYNPAGISRIKTQQLVLGVVAIPTSFKYRGSVGVFEPPLDTSFPGVTAQGGTFNLVPNLHYVAPITDCLGFGFSITVPFGLKTDYGRTTPLSYAATLTSMTVIDFSPSLGLQVTDNGFVGIGLDVQAADAEFDNVGTLLILPDVNANTTNKVSGVGYGYHFGVLYQYAPEGRVGLSYHSAVHHHLAGTSAFTGFLAEAVNVGQPLISNRAYANITLPAYTALSFYQKVNPRLGIMATAIYTQWSVIQNLTLNNFAGAVADPTLLVVPSTNIELTLPEHYRNTWFAAVGADYVVNECGLLRVGLGYDQTPVRNAYRHVQLPDADRVILGLGGHYQINSALGVDLSYAHLFVGQAKINPPAQVMGGQTVTTKGTVSGGADIYGVQIVWNM